MSDQESKDKHSQRLMQKNRHIKRQVKLARLAGADVSEPHRFAKHNAMDCGIPNCQMCSNPRHNKAVKDHLTIQEKRIKESFKSNLIETD